MCIRNTSIFLEYNPENVGMANEERLTIGFLVFEGMQLLDFANPWEVFAAWNKTRQHSGGNILERIKFSIDTYSPVSNVIQILYLSDFKCQNIFSQYSDLHNIYVNIAFTQGCCELGWS